MAISLTDSAAERVRSYMAKAWPWSRAKVGGQKNRLFWICLRHQLRG